MSHLQCFCYKGFGEEKKEQLWYSQAVRVGDRIECAGQGGWDPATSKVHEDIGDEVDQAFANVDLTLRDAGGEGWSQVYKVTVYLVEVSDEIVGHLVRNLKKWCPNHQPILTALAIKELGLPGMRVEVEVAAHDPEGAKVAVQKK
ncbi:endoribonuclease L-psp family protein [Ascodesmis nigricans]|uniref:Endoribonuclease L-psp family protein n=1 Tax=Ascodesmis nigricans TaxID=341454 RepID=A0A4V3SJV8_9PEZI|nr:endoribonuclease L-psp family protein [Ascodesmis nigricans]